MVTNKFLRRRKGICVASRQCFFFVKLSSGTNSSHPVLFDIRDNDPDESPTGELEVLPPEILMFFVRIYNFRKFFSSTNININK